MRQGEVYWIRLRGEGSEPDGRRPVLVVQHDRFNRSAISTTVVAAITSNLMRSGMPGNVRLRKGEANLDRPSVVNVSYVLTVDRSRLTERIGAVGPGRLSEVLRGLGLLLGIEADETGEGAPP